MSFFKDLLAFRSFYEVRVGLKGIILALVPVAVMIAVVELGLSAQLWDQATHKLDNSAFQLQAQIYYLAAGAVHILVCILALGHFYKSIKLTRPKQYNRPIFRTLVIATLVLFIALFGIDKTHCIVAELSHERIYSILARSLHFQEYFYSEANGTPLLFNKFSIMPGGLICFALAVLSTGCFAFGTLVYEFQKSKESIAVRVSSFLDLMKTHALVLSAVLVSSTVATMMYVMLPVTLVADESTRQEYGEVSQAVGIMWGAVFSLTLLMMCIAPLQGLRSNLKVEVERQRLLDDQTALKWMKEHGSTLHPSSNLKLALSIVSPFVVSLLSVLLSKL